MKKRRLKKKIYCLRRLLRPLAAMAKHLRPTQLDDYPLLILGRDEITALDVRRAAIFLKETKEKVR